MVIEMVRRITKDALLFAVGEMLARSKRASHCSTIDPEDLKGKFCSLIEAYAAGHTAQDLTWEEAFRLSEMSRRNRLSDRPPEQINRLCGLREKATYLDLVCAANFEFRSQTGSPGFF